MGLIIALYKSSLFSIVSLDFLPISQFICRSLRLIWVFFAVMCGLHVSFWSSIRPRYFTSFLTGSCVPFIVTTGQSVFRFVNVTCADLVSLTFISQLLSQASSWLRRVWRLRDAVCGFSLFAIIAVSSANVAMTVSFLVGMLAVNIRYRRRPRTLPWGTPEWTGKLSEVYILYFIWE